MYRSSRVSGGGREVQPGDRSLWPAEAGCGSEHQLLMDRAGATVDGPANKVPVVGFQLVRSHDVPRPHRSGETGRIGLDSRLDPSCKRLQFGGVPFPGHSIGPRIARYLAWNMGVGPDHLASSRRTGGICRSHLADQHEGARWHPARRNVRAVLGHLVQAVRQVHRARVGDLLG